MTPTAAAASSLAGDSSTEPKRLFDFDPSRYVAEYARKGYVHIRAGLDPAFLSYAQRQARELAEREAALKEWEFKGKKQQFLFEFPGAASYEEHLLAPVAAVTGLPLATLTLCERHIKAYDGNAPPNPPPHKDRVASEVAVGIPLAVPANSHVVLYPDHFRDINPFGSTAQLRASLDPDQLPEKILAGIEPVRVDVQPGDIIMFRGSAIWHERVNPANTSLLYLKFNGMRLDPLGEDPRTPAARERSLARLAELSDEQLLDAVVDVSPSLDRVSRHYTRLYWKEVIQAYVWGEKELTISEDDLRAIQAADGKRTVREIIVRLGVDDTSVLRAVPAIRRLIRFNALELVR